MAQKLWVLVVVLSLMAGGTAAAQDARAILQAASTAIGAGNVKSIQYSVTGWNPATGRVSARMTTGRVSTYQFVRIVGTGSN